MFDIQVFGWAAFAKLCVCHDGLENWWLAAVHPDS